VIFSGDNNNDDGGVWNASFANKSDNSRHVFKVLHGGGLPHGDLLNGAVIFGGYDTAGSFGGGVEAVSASLELDYVALQGNLSHSGGAVYLWKSDSSHITNTYFIGNHATNGSALGEYGTHDYLANCVVQGNVSDSGLFAVSGGVQRVVFVSMGGNDLGSGVIARSDSGQLAIDRSVFWSNSYQQSLVWVGGSPSWSNSDVQGGITGSSWNSNMGTDSGGNFTTDPSWNSASRADDGNGNLLSEDDGLVPKSVSILAGSIPLSRSSTYGRDLIDNVRNDECSPGAYEPKQDAQQLELGYYNSTTRIWTKAERIVTFIGPYDTNDTYGGLAHKLGTNANYNVRLSVSPNKHVGAKFYGYVYFGDSLGNTITGSVKMYFFRDTTIGGKWIYYNYICADGGECADGKKLLLINWKRYSNLDLAKSQTLYVDSKSKISLHVDVPRSQFAE